MCTARPCWKSISLQKFTYKDRCFKVRVNLPNIIHIDEDKRIVSKESSTNGESAEVTQPLV